MFSKIMWILYAIIIFFSVGCNKIEYTDNIKVLGKGGMGDENTYPMNSKIAFFSAKNYDIDGVEIDVQLTKDGKLIAFHNTDLSLMTNLNGSVYEYTWTYLKENVRIINQKYKRYSLISVDEIIDIFPNNAFFSLDLKIINPHEDPDYNDKLLEAIALLKIKTNRFAIENSNIDFLDQLKALHPDIILYLGSGNPNEDLQLVIDHNFDGIVIPDNLADNAIIEKAKNNNITITIWQRTKTIQELIDLEASIIQVNNVTRFK